MLTPQEVSERAFPKASFGGYNMAQVDEFLDVLTEDYSAREPLLRAALDRSQYGDHRLDDPLLRLVARGAEAGGADSLQRLLGPFLPDRVGHG